MAKTITFEGQTHTFPDDFSDAEIQAALTGPSEYRNLPPPPKDPAFSVDKMVRNIPGSAVQFVKDVTAPIHSPVQTAKGLWKAGSGAAQLAIPGEQGNEGYARAVGQGLKDRYGGTDALRRTLQEDPVGMASDVAGLLTGGATLAAKTAGGAALRTVGRNLDPVVAAQRYAGAFVPQSTPRNLMESALKPSTTMSRKDRGTLVDTALEHRISPTEAGVAKLQRAKEALGDELDALIAGAAQTGQRVPATRVLRGLRDLRRELGGAGLKASADLDAVRSVVVEWMDSLQKQGIRTLGIEDLQKLKTDAYKRINFDRSQQKASMPVEETYKTIAKGARQEIERQIPAIADVNRRYGNIEQSMPAVERAANRIGNRDVMGIGLPIKVGTGAAVGGTSGALIGQALGMVDTPLIKAQLAHTLEALRRKGYGEGPVKKSYTTTRAAAAAAGRLPPEEQE